MKYTKEQRLDIAKRVYDGELTVEEAAVEYDLNPSSVKGYLRIYRAETGLPPRTRRKKIENITQHIEEQKDSGLKEYEAMSKEELIDALVMARINEASLKSERKWCGEEVSSYRQWEYQVILELSGDFPVNLLCEKMEIQRSSFCNGKHRIYLH
jgi:transposase